VSLSILKVDMLGCVAMDVAPLSWTTLEEIGLLCVSLSNRLGGMDHLLQAGFL
jgi:hypothetical protein